MEYLEKYNSWLNNKLFDEETKNELRDIKDNENEIKERFYKDLEFGTAGLRGIMGAGTNRMNKIIIFVIMALLFFGVNTYLFLIKKLPC